MNARPWILSSLTSLVLIGFALFFGFILMWGMMHYKTSVKPYAYALFGVLSFLIIIIAGLFAGPLVNWAAKRMFPNSPTAETLVCLAAAVLAVLVGAAALLIASSATLAAFDDPLPRDGSMMHVRFPEGTTIIHRSDQNTQTYDTKLIVRMTAAGWEEFRNNALFQPEGLDINNAPQRQDLRNWSVFENAGIEPQEYRWTNHNEPALLKVLALRDDDGRAYVYLYLLRNYRGS